MRSFSSRPDTETAGPKAFQSAKNRYKSHPNAEGLKESTEAESKPQPAGRPAQLTQQAANPVMQDGLNGTKTEESTDGGPEVSILGSDYKKEFKFMDIDTPAGNLSGSITISLIIKNNISEVLPDAEDTESKSPWSLNVFQASLSSTETEKEISSSISGSVLSAGYEVAEIFPGVTLSFGVDVLNAEFGEGDEKAETSLLKIKGEVSGEMGEDQIKGTFLDSPELLRFIEEGNTLGFSGSVEFTIDDIAEVKRIKELMELRDKLQPLMDRLDSEIGKYKELVDKHTAKVKELTDKFMEQNGIKKATDFTKKQAKALKKLLRENKVLKGLEKQLKTADKLVKRAYNATKPLLKKATVVASKMKTTAGKILVKTGLKVISKGLMKAIPIVNVLSVVHDLIVIYRFRNVRGSGDGETPWAWDEVPEESGEGESNAEKGAGSGDSEKEGELEDGGGQTNSTGKEAETGAGSSPEEGTKPLVPMSGENNDPLADEGEGHATPGQSGTSKEDTEGNVAAQDPNAEAMKEAGIPAEQIDKSLEEGEEESKAPPANQGQSSGSDKKAIDKEKAGLGLGVDRESDEEGTVPQQVYQAQEHTEAYTLTGEPTGFGEVMIFPDELYKGKMYISCAYEKPDGEVFVHTRLLVQVIDFIPGKEVHYKYLKVQSAPIPGSELSMFYIPTEEVLVWKFEK